MIPPIYTYSATEFLDTPIDTTDLSIPTITLPTGDIDPRLKLLSHSSRTQLHKCPRKYQLYRLNSEEEPLEETAALSQSVTFAYGTTVGAGIQSALDPKKYEWQVILDTFLAWEPDLAADNPKQKKSFYLALFAVQRFLAMKKAGFLKDYDLVYFTSPKTGEYKPAVELAFSISLPGGYSYRGFIDAVLKHKETGEIVVLECKTTSGTANPATYKNSGQALGYSVVLDTLVPEVSSYTVMYLVYESKAMEYKVLPFEKSLLQRALWLQELLIDTEMIELYNSYETYPMHGESCFDFFRECEYMGLCTLDTKNLVKPLDEAILSRISMDEARYDFTIEFDSLIQAQIAKGTKKDDPLLEQTSL